MEGERKVNQLSAEDAAFLAIDGETAWGHIGGLSLLDPSTTEGFGFERLAQVIEERIDLVPRFKWKLREVGLGLDEPYWVEAEDFDIHDHVHRIAVPAPGTHRELGELVGLLHARALERTRPLWEMWLIEGLEDGRVATFLKTHHCLMDGESGRGLAELMWDTAPEAPAPIEIPEAFQEARPRAPSEGRVVGNALQHLWDRSWIALRVLRQGATQLISDRLKRHDPFDPPSPADVPRLSFNAAVGPRRMLAFTDIELERVKAVKRALDVTVNDVVLEIAGSALRRYLHERGELPARPLVAYMPVSLRAAGDKRLGNQVSMVSVSLETDLRDPLDRLVRIHRGAARAREMVDADHFNVMLALRDAMTPFAAHALIEMASSRTAVERLPLIANFVVSNVRGAPIPLYTAGAKVEASIPMSVVQAGQGLNITVVSYAGRLNFGITVDPHLVPDPWALTEGIEPALEELERELATAEHPAREHR
jgi:WS/DGAT/MGAT family acyltransferase